MKNVVGDSQIKEIVKELAINIKHGVVEPYGHRPYDAIDFLPMLDKREAILDYLKLVPNTDNTRNVRIFLENYFGGDIIPKEKYAVMIKQFGEVEICCKHDKNGMLIPNTGIKITDEEKCSLLNYLIEHNIPVTRGTFRSVFNRYKRLLTYNIQNDITETPKDVVLIKNI
mgnify:CR=1 FL=1